MIFWLLGRGFSSGWGYWLSPKASLSPKDAFLRDSWDGFLHQHWQSIGWLHVVLFYLSIVLRGFWTRTRTMIQVWTFWAILQNHILKLSNFKSSNWKNPSSPFWDIQKKQPTNLQGNSQKSCLFCSNFSRPQKDVAPFLAIPPAASPFLEPVRVVKIHPNFGGPCHFRKKLGFVWEGFFKITPARQKIRWILP